MQTLVDSLMPFIHADKVNLTLDNGKQLLSNVSFSLAKQQILGIVGPNGAGKSSLIHCILGLNPKTSGQISIADQALSSLKEKSRARLISAVLQEIPSDIYLTVTEVIESGRAPYRHWLWGHDDQAQEKVDFAIEKLKLHSLKHQTFNTLSGGEKKRVLIARALAQDTQILVLDEPANHLDIQHQIELMYLLKSLPITLIISLHDIQLAARFCDQLLVLDQGKVVQQGLAKEILTQSLFEQVFKVKATTYTNQHDCLSIHTEPLTSH